MTLNYLAGKSLGDCDTDSHALLIGWNNQRKDELFVTNDEELRFLVTLVSEYGQDLQSLFSRGGFDYLTCFCNMQEADDSLRETLAEKKDWYKLCYFFINNQWVEISFPEKVNPENGKL